MTYLEKASEAQAFADAGFPLKQLPTYPFVAAEAMATGSSPKQAADAILAAAVAWRALAPQIEQLRRTGKLAVAAAEDAQAVEQAKDTALKALEKI